jgi:phage tail sheath protein FI
MPEYLAPGVYVEETSFRAKSIEGVGTSTTAFVGPTRKGPLATTDLDANGNAPVAPELLTSFGDFERMYGGIEDLEFGPNDPPEAETNFLAHSVLQFFNEGGSRLYVARVANQPAPASTANLRDGQAADESVFIRSRFGGSGGNGRATIAEIATPTTVTQLDSAAEGLFLRVSDPTSAPASLEGGPLPADLTGLGGTPTDAIVLNLTVNGTPRAIGFAGEAAVLTATTDLTDDPVVVLASAREFRLRVNGVLQVIQLPLSTPLADFADALTALLDGVTADFDGDRLRLTTERRGTSASIQVLTDALGFAAGASATAAFDADDNNVADLSHVTFAELQTRLAAMTPALPAGTPSLLEAVELPGGRFALRTRLATSNADIAIRPAGAGEVSSHPALGLPAPGAPPETGTGAASAFFQRARVNNALIWHEPGQVGNVLGATQNRELHLISYSIVFDGVDGDPVVYDDVALNRDHPRFAGALLAESPSTRAQTLLQPIWFEIGDNVDPLELYNALFPVMGTRVEDGRRVAVHELNGGGDGLHPMVGIPTDPGSYAAAFEQLRGLEDISIVAAPGHSAYPGAESIRGALIAHAERPRAYRIAVLDAPPNLLPGDARAYRSTFDSHRAAFYYPWVTIANPLFRPGRDDVGREINLPPSGFICGIYARNDVEQGVAKAPANEIVRGALRFESDINFAQQQMLNPLGINCLRFFSGRGFRVWGARTASSDPEWKYVNVRRFFLYLESSIDRGTQWVVFENNGPRLWANVRETVEAFLYNEWVSGNLLGANPKEAYFVRCDRSTMTQNDLDNGRLICLIGVAALKPAEFVIFRIGQKTADARS